MFNGLNLKRFKSLQAATSKIMHDKYSSKTCTEIFGFVKSHDVQMEDPRFHVRFASWNDHFTHLFNTTVITSTCQNASRDRKPGTLRMQLEHMRLRWDIIQLIKTTNLKYNTSHELEKK